MNIAWIVDRVEPADNRHVTPALPVAERLAAAGNDVTVFCQKATVQSDRVTIVPLGRRGLSQWSAGQSHYDIVHAMTPVAGANVYQPERGTVRARLAATRRRYNRLSGPIIAGVQAWQWRHLRTREDALLADDACWHVGQSELATRELEPAVGRTEHVATVLRGVDVPDPSSEQRTHDRQETRYRMNLSARDVLFVCVTTDLGHDGLDHLIRGLGKLAGREGLPTTHLLCLGGKMIEGYRRLAGMSGIGNRVHFVDLSEDVFRHYAAADAVVQLSWHDPASRSVLEAVRWGIPTLTSAFDGASEIVARGTGVVVDSPANLRDVTDGLQLLTDPQVRAQFSTACEAVQHEISLDRHVERLLDVYKKVSL